ncbi:MAG: asparagine synthase (glutamine-hydrolyzing) [Congregibacter sp.]
MCGIAGFSRFHRPLGDRTTLETMGHAIRHRGPDAEGSYLDEHVGLHHRRLAIVDLSEAGVQPMQSLCGRYMIIFNGEIYNFLELRSQLQESGVTFATQTDTEVILALYAQRGRECLESLNGMFAFAIWDKSKRQLFLARDRIGKKPLYYTFLNGDIAFASELKSLLSARLFERRVRLDALHDFFAYQYVPDPKTIFEGVFKLEPGYWLEVSVDGYDTGCYWDLSFPTTAPTDQVAHNELRGQIERATQRRMIADVPLGAFLSGGVDSSGIVATMASHSKNAITTCSIGFDEERFNETEFAKAVAEHCKTDHHEFIVSESVAENLRSISRYFDEPFADPSLVPTFFVSKLARKRVTVALAGDGGDEVFAGYEKYAIDAVENLWRQRVPAALRQGPLAWLAPRLQGSTSKTLRRAGTLLSAIAQDPAVAFYQSNAQITDEQWAKLAQPDVTKALGSYHPSQVTVDAYRRCDGVDHLSKILYADIKTYLPGDILVKVDRMSMAHALEVRAPLLDYQLVEFAAALPSSMKFRKGEKKRILKAVFSDLLPKSIIERRKMGFSPPLAEWFRGELNELFQDTVIQASEGVSAFLNTAAVTELWQEHQNRTHDHGAILWSLLMFQLWWEEYMT